MRAPFAAFAGLMLLPVTAFAVTTLEITPSGQHEPGVNWVSAPGMLPPETQALMHDRLTPRLRDLGPDGRSAINLIEGLHTFEPSSRVVRRLERQQTRAILARGRERPTTAEGHRRPHRRDERLLRAREARHATGPAHRHLLARRRQGAVLGEGGGSEVANAELLDRPRRPRSPSTTRPAT